jgi:hypothetical protein
MVFSQQYHAEVSLNIPTRDRWTAHASELSDPVTTAKARIEGFPCSQHVFSGVAFLQQSSGDSSNASRHSLSMNPRRTHGNRPIAGRKRARLCTCAQPPKPLPRAVAGRREACESNLQMAWEMLTWLHRYPD